MPTQHFRLVAIDPDEGGAFVLELSDPSFGPLLNHPFLSLLFSGLRRQPRWTALVTNVDGERLREEQFATFDEGRAWLLGAARTIEAGDWP